MSFADQFRTPFGKPSFASSAGALLGGNFGGGGGMPLSGVLARMLDEIDYGMVLVTAAGRLRWANHLGLRRLAGGAGLRLVEGIVGAALAGEQGLLRGALADAARGLRRMLSLDTGERRASISVVPLAPGEGPADAGEDDEPLVMLMLGKQPASETLTLDFFARSHRLTPAESSVLHGLCAGHRPKEIAQSLGVAISTVRTQIGSIRIKTETRSIRDLVNRVATLPPITPAMKRVACH